MTYGLRQVCSVTSELSQSSSRCLSVKDSSALLNVREVNVTKGFDRALFVVKTKNIYQNTSKVHNLENRA